MAAASQGQDGKLRAGGWQHRQQDHMESDGRVGGDMDQQPTIHHRQPLPAPTPMSGLHTGFAFYSRAAEQHPRPRQPHGVPFTHPSGPSAQVGGRLSKFVATTPAGETISIEIPPGLQQSWVQAMDMSPLDSVHCDSPGFNNFMMTLSPIMQLSSPQPTMSPREQSAQPMSPIVEGEEIPFAFSGPNETGNKQHPSLISIVENCSLTDENPSSPRGERGTISMAVSNTVGAPSNPHAAAAAAAAVAAVAGSGGAVGNTVSGGGQGFLRNLFGRSSISNKENTVSQKSLTGQQTHLLVAGRGSQVAGFTPMPLTGVYSPATTPLQATGGVGARAPTMSYVPTGPKKCNCRKSKCLKLYCECFASGLYCQDECGCVECNNTQAYEVTRGKAIQSIMSRNPNAFTEKIQYIAEGEGEGTGAAMLHATPAHVRGCHCKKSFCIKKYCECFFAGVYCGENCKCEGCKNYEGSEALESSRAASALSKVSSTAVVGNSPSSTVPTQVLLEQQLMHVTGKFV